MPWRCKRRGLSLDFGSFVLKVRCFEGKMQTRSTTLILPHTHHYNSETGRIRFRRVRFQTPNSVSFLGLTEFRRENSVSSFHPIICVLKRTHRVFLRTHRVWRRTQWVLSSETVLSKQYSARFPITSLLQHLCRTLFCWLLLALASARHTLIEGCVCVCAHCGTPSCWLSHFESFGTVLCLGHSRHCTSGWWASTPPCVLSQSCQVSHPSSWPFARGFNLCAYHLLCHCSLLPCFCAEASPSPGPWHCHQVSESCGPHVGHSLCPRDPWAHGWPCTHLCLGLLPPIPGLCRALARLGIFLLVVLVCM